MKSRLVRRPTAVDADSERVEVERELTDLAQKLLSAQEEERQRIAADLHDGLGQQLSAIKWILEGFVQRVGARLTQPERDGFERLVERTGEAIDEVRRIAMDLRPSMIDDLGVTCAIDWFCAELRHVFTSVAVVQDIRAEEDAIPPKIKASIFRILQEACNNACKYSGANCLSVRLDTDADGIRLAVMDNGIGFDPEAVRQSLKGFGLGSMRERATLTGGRFSLWSKPGEGTEVLVNWPRRQNGSADEQTVVNRIGRQRGGGVQIELSHGGRSMLLHGLHTD